MDKIYNNLSYPFSHDQFYIEYQDPPIEMPNHHWHNHIEFNYLYSGSMEYIFGDQSFNLPTQKLVFFWGGIPHKSLRVESSAQNNTQLCNLYYPLESFLLWDKSTQVQSLLMEGNILTLDAPASFISMLIDVWQKDVSQRNQQALEAISLEIRALLNRYPYEILLSAQKIYTLANKESTHQKQKLFVKTLRYILQNLQEPLTSQSISAYLGYHPNHIQRNFQAILGISLHQFIIHTRLKYACSLLSETNRPILDIAIESGFGSISQFYNSFQKIYNQTPKEYRQSQKTL